MTTIREWLSSAAPEALDKTFLVEHVTGMNKAAQLIHGDRELTEKETGTLNQLAAKRMEGVPLPYLLGSQEFFGRSFIVTPSVLIPRPDTECLIEWLIEHLPRASKVCDLGTGSGCIAITLKLERPDLYVCASDISEKALGIAKENASALNAEVDFFEGSWLEAYPSDLPLDAIISNPPYISKNDEHLTALRYEPINALTDHSDGLSAYREIFKQSAVRIPQPRMVAVEHGWDQEEKIQELFLACGLGPSRTYKDYGGNPRFSVWERSL